MHFSNLVIHSCDIETKMEIFCYEYEYNRVFQKGITKKNAIKEYKDYMKDKNNFINDIEKFVRFTKGGYVTYHIEENSYQTNEKRELGFFVNPIGLYDWYEVGGRWNNILPLKDNFMVNEAPVDMIDFNKLNFDMIENIITFDDKVIELDKIENKMNFLKKSIKQAKKSGEDIYITIVDCHS